MENVGSKVSQCACAWGVWQRHSRHIADLATSAAGALAITVTVFVTAASSWCIYTKSHAMIAALASGWLCCCLKQAPAVMSLVCAVPS
jgi:hypothetical protein